MVYSFSEFKMHPALNMIIGPNGTGKSTIVCALAVGLATNPKVTGRGNEVWDYVRNGAEDGIATVDIELSMGQARKKPMVIRRVINKHERKSNFFIDGKSASVSSVGVQLKQLNVQVENICQFLPQERVSALAAMSDVELLKEVQKAAGPLDMLGKHEQLVQLDDDVRALEHNVQHLVQEIETLVGKNSAIEAQYTRIQNRAQIRKKFNLTRAALASAKYDLIKERIRVAFASKQEHEANVTQLRELLEPLDAQLSTLRDQFNVHKNKGQEPARALADQLGELASIKRDVGRMEQTIDRIIQDIEDAKSELVVAQRGLDKIEADIRGLEAQLADIPDNLQEQQEEASRLRREQAGIDDQIARLRVESQAVENNTHDLLSNEREMSREQDYARRQIHDFQNEQNPRWKLLQQIDHGEPARMFGWIRANRGNFHGQVRGPLLMEMDLEDRQLAHLVEATLNPMLLTRTYLIEDPRDHELLCQQFIDDGAPMKARINLAEHHESPIDWPYAPEMLHQLGFQGVLLDLVKADNYILSYLANQAGLNRTPYSQSNRPIDPQLAWRHHIQRYIFDRVLFNSRSHPSSPDDIVTTTNQIHRSNFLHTESGDDLRRKIEDLQAKVDELDERIAEVRHKREKSEREVADLKMALTEKNSERVAIAQRIKNLSHASQARADLQRKLAAARQRLEKEAQKPIGLQRKVDRLETDKAKVHKERVFRVAEIRSLAAKIPKILNDKRIGCLQAAVSSHIFKAALDKAAHLKDELARATDDLKRATDAVADYRRQATDIKSEWQTAAVEVDENVDTVRAQVTQLRTELELVDKPLDDQVNFLHNKVDELEATLDMASATDDSIVQQYENRQAMIDDKQAKLEEEQNKLADKTQERDELKNDWLPTLEAFLETVSNNFSAYFSYIRCAGEVSLKKADMFKDYALEIRVKFRATQELQVLEKSRQSGGERAVTTILFLLSLQEHSKAPFRLVDEINQGMDEINERMVHKLLVESASKPGSPQYFLITPKLLCGLYYSDKMRVHCVYNGPDVDPLLSANDADFGEEEDIDVPEEPITVSAFIAKMRELRSANGGPRVQASA
ncbi:P-loop containing nucleoside triphosphate hydrolase protein [Catenaria anguillulae PL171]|uniref:Structural maintenance of chromosomes protein 5 n=1 Tax=Catenaria anguillulae PL171 TaxID=765915 RepID=A0A1Y2HWA2_9FUNG|nr:P-loop containing nucleoside triphosphate hydrolase protein [Catenaria anguillulae PL171]